MPPESGQIAPETDAVADEFTDNKAQETVVVDTAEPVADLEANTDEFAEDELKPMEIASSPAKTHTRKDYPPSFFTDDRGNLKAVNFIVRNPCKVFWLISELHRIGVVFSHRLNNVPRLYCSCPVLRYFLLAAGAGIPNSGRIAIHNAPGKGHICSGFSLFLFSSTAYSVARTSTMSQTFALFSTTRSGLRRTTWRGPAPR